MNVAEFLNINTAKFPTKSAIGFKKKEKWTEISWTDFRRLVFKTAQLYNFENGNPLLTTIDKYARYALGEDGKYHIKSKLPNKCLRLWSGAVINSKGDLVPCCFDKDSKHSFGNISSQSFSTTWHNKKASNFRKSILENRKQFDMCRNCTSK